MEDLMVLQPPIFKKPDIYVYLLISKGSQPQIHMHVPAAPVLPESPVCIGVSSKVVDFGGGLEVSKLTTIRTNSCTRENIAVNLVR